MSKLLGNTPDRMRDESLIVVKQFFSAAGHCPIRDPKNRMGHFPCHRKCRSMYLASMVFKRFLPQHSMNPDNCTKLFIKLRNSLDPEDVFEFLL